MDLKLKFGVSTWLFTSPFTTETISIFPKIKKMGFDVVEIAVEEPSFINIEKVRKALVENSLDVAICGAFGTSRDLTSEDIDLQNNSMKYIESCLDICVALGAKYFVGPMYSAVGKARMVSTEQRDMEWNRAVINLRKVCEMAHKRGLLIGLEPLNRFETDLINTCSDVKRLIKDINHPSAKIALDSFHMSVEEPDIEEAILLAGEDLLHIQVSENHRGIPGTGQTYWEAYKRGLQKIQYTGTISIESFTTDNKELAAAVCIWKPLAESQDIFASEGLRFIYNLLVENVHEPLLSEV